MDKGTGPVGMKASKVNTDNKSMRFYTNNTRNTNAVSFLSCVMFRFALETGLNVSDMEKSCSVIKDYKAQKITTMF